MPLLISRFEIDPLNPVHNNYPLWPAEKRVLKLYRTDGGTFVVITKGLAEKVACPYEVYLETDEEMSAQDFSSSWQTNLVYETGKIIPRVQNFREKIEAHRYLSLQIDMEGAPDEWSLQHENGNIGLFIGMDNPSITELTGEAVPLNIKLMRPQELLFSIEHGEQGRHQLAELYHKQRNATLSSLERISVI
jgi:hypothetical protein